MVSRVFRATPELLARPDPPELLMVPLAPPALKVTRVRPEYRVSRVSKVTPESAELQVPLASQVKLEQLGRVVPQGSLDPRVILEKLVLLAKWVRPDLPMELLVPPEILVKQDPQGPLVRPGPPLVRLA